MTEEEARRCVNAIADYLQDKDDSPRAAADLRRAVDVLMAGTDRDFYERRLREEWESVGGTVRGTWFYHPLLPGFSGDSRSCWKYLIQALTS